jgi:hypothetical protein
LDIHQPVFEQTRETRLLKQIPIEILTANAESNRPSPTATYKPIPGSEHLFMPMAMNI